MWGSERALLDLLNVLPTSDVAVCSPPKTPLNRELDRLGIRTLPYFVYGLHQKSRLQRLQAAAGVFKACLAFRPDIIYLNQCGSYKVVLPAAMIFDLPIVAHVRLFEDASYLAKRGPSSQRLRGLIAISSAIEAEIRRFRELDCIELHRIYDAYIPFSPAIQPSERRLNRVACIGRLVPIKGQDLLIDAISRLNGYTDTVECIFAGDGERHFVQILKERAVSAHSRHVFQWHGFVDDVVPLLRGCSVLVCPSHREPLGRVIFEAWDAGAIPLVFSGSGGAAEVVAAAKGGILYSEQTPQSLGSALQAALQMDPKRQSTLVENGRSWMSTHCNSEIYGKSLSRILSSAASRSDI